jgi:hypothetical protein
MRFFHAWTHIGRLAFSQRLMKIQIFWDVPCRLVKRSKGLRLQDPEDEDITLPRNVGSCLPVDRP